MKVNIFNSSHEEYIITSHTIIEGEVEKIVDVYEGNLSRKQFIFELPMVEGKLIRFYYNVYDRDKNLAYQSFHSKYIIQGWFNWW